jgi:hypothetical protein
MRREPNDRPLGGKYVCDFGSEGRSQIGVVLCPARAFVVFGYLAGAH